MNYQTPGGQTPPPAGHIYVNGYGFVSEDPWFRESRGIWKNAAVIGLVLLGILFIPAFSVYPIQLLLNLIFAPFVYLSNSAYQSMSLQAVYLELGQLAQSVLSLGIPLILAACLLRPRKKSVPLTRRPSSNTFSYGVAMCMAVWVVATFILDTSAGLLQNLHLVELHPENSMPAVLGAVPFYLIRVLVVPALLEEFLFRGVILRSLRQFGDSFAIVVSAFSFSLIHYNLSRDLRAFLLGLVLGYFVIRSGSIWTAVAGRFCCLLLSLASENLPHLFPGTLSSTLRILLFLAVTLIGMLAFVRFSHLEGNPFILSSGHTSTRISVKLRKFFSNIVFLISAALWIAQIFSHIQIIG